MMTSSMKPTPGASSPRPRESVTSPTACVGSCCCSCRLAQPARLPLMPVASSEMPQLLLKASGPPPGIRLLQRSRLRRMLDAREQLLLKACCLWLQKSTDRRGSGVNCSSEEADSRRRRSTAWSWLAHMHQAYAAGGMNTRFLQCADGSASGSQQSLLLPAACCAHLDG